MKRTAWSGSKTTLLYKCQYWAKPGLELPEQEESEAARIGTDRHAVLEAIAREMVGQDAE